jgi:hypothetical protein
MNLAYRQRRMLAIVIAALAAGAVIAATIRESRQTAMLVVFVVALLAAYAVRHHVRARVLYRREMDSPTAIGHPPPARQPARPAGDDHHKTVAPHSVAEVAAAYPAIPDAHRHGTDQDDHDQRRERQVS